ncbi:MAG: hypothetical protein EBQ96_01075 [Proteobacteria bacterium]|nr:hypothetical protein [Pseudomonadota bacterium]
MMLSKQPSLPEWSEAHAVLDMADLVRREGNRVYSSSALAEGLYQSMLCGLTVSFLRGGNVCAMKAHDLDVTVSLHEAAIEQDDGIERNSPVKMIVSVSYMKGSAETLATWHRHLCLYRQSIRIAPRETVTA